MAKIAAGLHFLCRMVRAVAPIWIALNASGAAFASQDASRAFDALSSQPLVRAANAGLGLAASQNDNVMLRMAALRGGARGLDVTGLDVQVGDQRIAGDALNVVSRPTLGGIVDGVLSESAAVDRVGLFVNGSVLAAQPNIGGSHVDVTGGFDYRVFDTLALGASLGYTHLAGEGQATLGTLDVVSWRGAMYGTYYYDGFHVDGLLAYGSTRYDSQRRIEFESVNGTNQVLAKGDTFGRQLSAQFASAFDFRYGPWMFGPHVGASFIDAHVAPLDEVGGGDYGLFVGSQSAQSLRFNAGAHLALPALAIPGALVTPQLNADYVHDLDNRAGQVAVRRAGELGIDGAQATNALLQIDRPDAGYFVWSVGATAKLTRALSGYVDYRSFASVGDTASTELSWGLRFNAIL